MENSKSVDQQRNCIRHFIEKHRDALRRQGAIVSTWRRRGSRKYGPYYLLTVRTSDGRQQSVYLGSAGALVNEVRRELSVMQAPHRERRQLNRVRRHLLKALTEIKRQLDADLATVGLRRQGNEFRGWKRLGAPAKEIGNNSPQPLITKALQKAVRQ